MGIFANFKKMFSKDICPNESELLGVVYPYPTKGHQIVLGTKVQIPEGFDVVFGHNGKVLDFMSAGTVELTLANLPKCSQKLKLNKQDKNGNYKKKFKAEMYFVNKKDNSITLTTYDKAELGNRANGIFTCGLIVNILFKVNDSQRFMEVLLNEYDYIKINEAEKILKCITSDILISILNKYNFAISDIVAQNPVIIQSIKDELAKRYTKLGLVLAELCDLKFILPKKYQKKYEDKLEYAKQSQNINQPKIEETQNQDAQVSQNEEPKIDNIEEYIPFGNIQIETQNENIVEKDEKNDIEKNTQTSVKQQENEIINQQTNVEQQENETSNAQTNVEQKENKNPNEQFVDLNFENIFENEQNPKGIKCLHCGYINSVDNTYCEICENKLK